MLTTGRITPLIIQQWGSACTRFQKMSGTADDKVVSFVADAMMEPRLVSWYTSDRVRIDALTLKEYLKELSDLTLEKNWAHLIRQQILSAKQPDKTRFIDWKIELENLNALLVTSSPTHALSHQENRIYIIEEKNWRIILYYLEFAQINANYMNLHFLLNQKGPRKF